MTSDLYMYWSMFLVYHSIEIYFEYLGGSNREELQT